MRRRRLVSILYQSRLSFWLGDGQREVYAGCIHPLSIEAIVLAFYRRRIHRISVCIHPLSIEAIVLAALYRLGYWLSVGIHPLSIEAIVLASYTACLALP